MKVKKLKLFIFVLILALANNGCLNRSLPISSANSGSPGIFQREETLSSAKVETAANQMVSRYRLGGQIKVTGVREIPKENAAVADLQFGNFEYAITNDGANLIEAAKYKPPPDLSRRNPTDPLPSMEEMFPPRKQIFNSQGTATLAKYNDGRWVLKEVRWGGYSVAGMIEVQ